MGKPLYTGEWRSFTDFDGAALGTLVRRIAKPGSRMAEIGSWLGNGSTQVFLKTLAGYSGSSLLCVDTWRGSENVLGLKQAAENYDIFGTFQMYVSLARSPTKVQAFVGTSVDAAELIADGTFDLVFIDAEHSYKATSEDIALWRSKLRPGGILCGHDCEVRVTVANEARLRANSEMDTIDDPNSPLGIVHPGCALAVHEAFAGGAQLCSETPVSLPNGVSGVSSIWFTELA